MGDPCTWDFVRFGEYKIVAFRRGLKKIQRGPKSIFNGLNYFLKERETFCSNYACGWVSSFNFHFVRQKHLARRKDSSLFFFSARFPLSPRWLQHAEKQFQKKLFSSSSTSNPNYSHKLCLINTQKQTHMSILYYQFQIIQCCGFLLS